MSHKFKRRRKRTGSTSARFRPAPLVPVESMRPASIGRAELAACGAVCIVALTLIALIWLLTTRAVQEQRAEIRERAEQHLAGEAASIAETVGHELLMIDQSLTILQAAWKQDSDLVDLEKSQKLMPALTGVTDDLFICDDQHIIRQDILPKAVGQGVGAAYVTFPHGSLEQFGSDGSTDRDSLVVQGETGGTIEARTFLMYVVRPLDHPKGWLLGASYRSAELTKLFAQGALGFNPLVALIDTKRGIVQSVVGPGARRPTTDVSHTPLFGMITRSATGSWIGESAIDGVERLHAFHTVPDREMAVLVAANLAGVMAPAESLAAGAHAVAFVATGLVLGIGGLVLWELFTIRGHRRQQRTFERIRAELDRLRAEQEGNTARTLLNAARLQVVLDHTADGIALFDSGLRLVQWNEPFRWGIGIEPVREMPLDTLLREQAGNGLFGPVADLEAEVASRAGILRTGDPAGSPQSGPGNETLLLRGMPIAEGGFILLLGGMTGREGAAERMPEIHRPAAAPETSASGSIDW